MGRTIFSLGTAGTEQVQDVVGAMLQNASGVTWTYNDGAGTITPAVDHGGLGGLTDDDHTGYARLAGRASGQILYGGTAASENLRLDGTSHVTAGYVYTLNSYWGVGTATPSYPGHIYQATANCDLLIETGSATATAGLRLKNSDRHWLIYNNGSTSETLVIRDVTAGIDRFNVSTVGGQGYIFTLNAYIGYGIAAPVSPLHLHNTSAASIYMYFTNSNTGSTTADGTNFGLSAAGALILDQRENQPINMYTQDTLRFMIDGSGNAGFITSDVEAWDASFFGFHLGSHASILAQRASSVVWLASNQYYASGARYYRATGATTEITLTAGDGYIRSAASGTIDTTITNYERMYWLGADGATSSGESATATSIYVRKNSGTSRSINAAGTVNASGADYAEYMVKNATCGIIAKGDVCGVDANGKLTDKYDEAKSFVVKSTDPSYVGGDIWGTPEAIGETGFDYNVQEELIPPPTKLLDSEGVPRDPTPEELAAIAAKNVVIQAEMTRRARIRSKIETARARVDRIAFCGQVPVNGVVGAQPGDFLIPLRTGTGGISAAAVTPGLVTFAQYRNRLGVVYKIAQDGRPIIAVRSG